MSARIYGHFLCVVFPFLFAASSVFAAENDFYAGASLGNASRSSTGGASIDPRDLARAIEGSASKIVGGLRPFNHLAFELSYVDFGGERLHVLVAGPAIPGIVPNSTGTFDSHALSMSALGIYPLPSVDLFGRIGVARWQSDSTTPPGSVREHHDGTDPSFGIGAQVNLPKIGLRAEYEGFRLAGGTTKLLSVGFVYRFH